ncbi:MAG: hypothetical protein WC300_03175 [Candidatus Omnitrophota bacterium]|jgi:hypothetical protein
MDREISPEERLLRLIKGKNRHRSLEPAGVQPGPAVGAEIPASVRGADPGISKGVLAPIRQKVLPLKAGAIGVINNMQGIRTRIPFNPYYLVIGLFAMLLISGIYIVLRGADAKEDKDVANLKQLIAAISDGPSTGNTQAETHGDGIDIPEPKSANKNSLDDYQRLISNKAVFAPPAAEKRKTQAQESARLDERSNDLKLVGVIPGDMPQAIIEDKKNNQTLFLREGEMVNGLEVKGISAGRVVLGCEEETLTLSL